MKDQDGFKVPNDLVLLVVPNYPAPFPDELGEIENLDWFESRGENKHILVSKKEFKAIFAGDEIETKEPESVGINLDEGVDTIYSTLKRHDAERGFYHA